MLEESTAETYGLHPFGRGGWICRHGECFGCVFYGFDWFVFDLHCVAIILIGLSSNFNYL